MLDRQATATEPRWHKSSIITQGHSVKLIIEVVSINWQDDYLTKLAGYEQLGIAECWLVDYAALGGRRFIGHPKPPTLSICALIDGEYELQQFRGSDRIISPTFPALQLTAAQIFSAGQS